MPSRLLPIDERSEDTLSVRTEMYLSCLPLPVKNRVGISVTRRVLAREMVNTFAVAEIGTRLEAEVAQENNMHKSI